MAKGTWRIADSPDDPIFNDELVISSHSSPRESNQSRMSSQRSMAGDQEEISMSPTELKQIGEFVSKGLREQSEMMVGYSSPTTVDRKS